MRFFLPVFALFLVCFFAGVFAQRGGRASSQALGGCTPGQTWKQDCNSCRCAKDGTPRCTRVLCPGKGIEADMPVLREPEDTNECEPGTRWKEDCNQCWCQRGYKACTRKLCRGSRRPSSYDAGASDY